MIRKINRQTQAINLLFLFIAVMLLVTEGKAQRSGEVPDSKGRDFILAFMPNFHLPRLDVYDSIGISITALDPANVTIRYRNRIGIEQVRTLTVNPDNIATVKFHYSELELIGENFDGRIGFPQGDNERTSVQTMRITSDLDITVYALNQAHYSSDAFLVLPTDALGDEYFVAAYNSNVTINPNGLISDNSTPSQFVVVALEDDTEVRIIPTAPTYRNGLAQQTVTLQAGEAYLVQASMTVLEQTYDLSGSQVVANKPIAVFGGHQRALLPVENDGLNSRDCLIEQIPPLDSWGRTIFITPYTNSRTMTNVGTDIYRVFAAIDETEVFLDGVKVAELQAGQFYQAPLRVPGVITANEPIMVAQYRRTGTLRADRQISRSGDPFMMIIPPAEQYAKKYKFINVQGLQGIQTNNGGVDGTEKAFDEHYITIISPDTLRGEIELDGALVPANSFQPIQGTTFFYANLSVGEGQHEIEAEDNIGVYVYGYGPANSYGYIAGGEFRKLDRFKPEIVLDPYCFGVNGMAYDTLELDSRIGEVLAINAEENNIRLTVQPFTKYADSVSFNAALINVFQDGLFELNVLDSMRNLRDTTLLVPGFTVHVEEIFTAEPVLADEVIFPGFPRCYTYELWNYGTSTQTITTAYLREQVPNLTLNVQLPLVLQPGERKPIQICYVTDSLVRERTTFIIGNECLEREILEFVITSYIDSIAPRIVVDTTECDDFIINFEENGRASIGVAEYEVIQNINTQVTVTQRTQRLLQLAVKRVNPRMDAFFTIVVRDSVGNADTVSGIMPGFTLRAIGFEGRELENLQFGNVALAQEPCDTVTVLNYGNYPITIWHSDIFLNIHFSSALHLFPMTLQPGERKYIPVCFRPTDTSSYVDTLYLSAFCEREPIPLLGKGVSLLKQGGTRCEAVVNVITYRIPFRFYASELFPNPSQGSFGVTVAVDEPSSVRVKLFNMQSIEVASFEEHFTAGEFTIDVMPEKLPPGMYMCVISNGKETITRKIIFTE